MEQETNKFKYQNEDLKVNWKTTSNRFVIFLDILGFKEFVLRSSHLEVYDRMEKLYKSLTIFNKYSKNDIHITTFSDSIFIFTKDDNAFTLVWVLTLLSNFLEDTIKNGIPIKGAIAHGIITVNKSKNIYCGQPIIDAFLLEEDLNYMGVVAHHSIDRYICNFQKKTSKNENNRDELMMFILMLKEINKILIEVQTPLKSGKFEHKNISYFVGKISPFKEMAKIIDVFKQSSSGNVRKYIDNTKQVLCDINTIKGLP